MSAPRLAQRERAVRRGGDRVDRDPRAHGVRGGDDPVELRHRARSRSTPRSPRPSACGRRARPRSRTAGSASVSRSGSAQRTVAPARSAAITHGRTFASWSRRVTTTSSPGPSVRPTAAESRIVIAVIDGPKATPAGSASSSRATDARARSTHASVACAAANTPPWLALSPERMNSAIASIAESTICVPAGPSSRTQLPASPGKRSRFTAAPAPRAPARRRAGSSRAPPRSRDPPSASRPPRRSA